MLMKKAGYEVRGIMVIGTQSEKMKVITGTE